MPRARSLHLQADRIELVLASHKVLARVTEGTVTPRLVRFRLSTPLGVRVRQVEALAEEIALSLGARSCRISREDGRLQVELPRPDARPVRLPALLRQLAAAPDALPPHTALLGTDQDGLPLLLRLPSPDVAHVLIAGTTGSGKTALARAMVASLASLCSPRSLQILVVDPKSRGLAELELLPHLMAPVVSSPEQALALLGRLVAEMERRDGRGRVEPRIVVVLDELADLVLCGGQPMEAALTRLTQRGREAGIHVVACTQKPTALSIGSLVKSNFPLRIVGAVASAEDAKVASGLPGTGAERLLGQGDFLLVAKGQVTRFQAAYLAPGHLRELPSLWRGRPPVRAAPGSPGETGDRPSQGRLLSTGTDGPPPPAGRLRAGLRLVQPFRTGD